MIIYQYLLWIKIPSWKKSLLRYFKANDDGRNSITWFDFKGNDLASLKVVHRSLKIDYERKVFESRYVSRMRRLKLDVQSFYQLKALAIDLWIVYPLSK